MVILVLVEVAVVLHLILVVVAPVVLQMVKMGEAILMAKVQVEAHLMEVVVREP